MAANTTAMANRTEVEHDPARFGRRDLTSENDRADRARSEAMIVRAIVEENTATGKYEVESESGSIYTIDLEAGRCECADYQHRETQCKHLRRAALEITHSGLVQPGETVFDFDINDVVRVDWSQGMGHEQEVIGVVTDITEANGQVIVSVTDYNSDEFVPGKTYDCAPEWITLL